jgi:hypothetical protein
MTKLQEKTSKKSIIILTISIISFITIVSVCIYAVIGKTGNIPWNGCEIPYSFSSDFSEQDRIVIDRAMNFITEKSGGIKFVKKSNQIEFVDFLKQNLTHLNICGSALLGKQLGGQQIIFNTDCELSTRLIIHEIMHSLGFRHEHQRPDRGNYIKLVDENIKEASKIQYEIKENIVWEKIVKNTPYDYSSVIHYDINNINIELVDKNIKLENYSDVSLGDIEKLKKYYQIFK